MKHSASWVPSGSLPAVRQVWDKLLNVIWHGIRDSFCRKGKSFRYTAEEKEQASVNHQSTRDASVPGHLAPLLFLPFHRSRVRNDLVNWEADRYCSARQLGVGSQLFTDVLFESNCSGLENLGFLGYHRPPSEAEKPLVLWEAELRVRPTPGEKQHPSQHS